MRNQPSSFEIPSHRLTLTNNAIFGFNANDNYPLGKIRLRCQIGDLKIEVTCYVIDTDTSYNLSWGGGPWIHANMVVPSTLYQCIKYVDGDGEMGSLIAEKQLFKGIGNYFIDAFLYARSAKVAPPLQNECDSGNEVVTKPEVVITKDEYEPLVISLIGLDVKYTTDDVGEWVVNENLKFAYFSCVASDSMP